MKKIIKGGTIVTESAMYAADILIDGEKIAAIGQNFDGIADAEVIDAAGQLVLPGGVDAHVHLDLPMPNTTSSDDHYTGTKAAAFGGTTTVIDFANHDLPSLTDSFRVWEENSAGKAAVDYAVHMNYTRFSPESLAEIAKLPELGVNSIKMFTAYNGRMRLQDGEIFQALRVAKEQGIISMFHVENGDLIDLQIAEALAAGHTDPIWHARTRSKHGAAAEFLNVCMLSRDAGDAPIYIVHMNGAEEADLLGYVKDLGINMHGETCPQYLMFTEADMDCGWEGAKYVCSPSMRGPEDNAALWGALEDGTMDVVATDHCPFMFDGTKEIMYEGKPFKRPGKELGRGDFTKIPNGQPGVGDRLPVMWTQGVNGGHISPMRFVQLMCTNPAKIFNIYPQKGCILPGADADIAIWDPAKKVRYGVNVAQHRTDYNLYEGMELTGFPVKVLLRGDLIVDNGEWKGKRGGGRFLHCKPLSE